MKSIKIIIWTIIVLLASGIIYSLYLNTDNKSKAEAELWGAKILINDVDPN